jgi:hypothetical protein
MEPTEHNDEQSETIAFPSMADSVNGAPVVELTGEAAEQAEYERIQSLTERIIADPVEYEQTIRRQKLTEQSMLIEAATYNEVGAKYRAQAALNDLERAQNQRKQSEEDLVRYRNRNRPSVFLGANVTALEAELGGRTVYEARYGDLAATGDTPDMAMDNFDHLWING